MCTAIRFESNGVYFGRTLDVELEYDASVTITPRDFPLHFKNGESFLRHSAIIGMAMVVDGFPLFFDAANEHGLAIAALRFADNAQYFPNISHKTNVASFEVIPYLLSKYKSIAEVKEAAIDLNITNTAFDSNFTPSPLHWILSDQSGALVLESTGEGLKVYENDIGVLTNNPTFPFQRENLAQYLHLTACEVENTFSDQILLNPFSRGMGAIGLPGDLSSVSRFVRAAFVKSNAQKCRESIESLTQYFHILSSVEQIQGCVKVGKYLERTSYSACIDCSKMIYYYKTYENSQLSAVSLFNENPDEKEIHTFPLIREQKISYQN